MTTIQKIQKLQTLQTPEQLCDFFITLYAETDPDLNRDMATQAFNYGLQGIEYIDCELFTNPDAGITPIGLHCVYDNINYIGYLIYLYDFDDAVQFIIENTEWGE